MHAAEKGRIDCVRLLIDAGADKDAKDNVRVTRCVVVVPFIIIPLFILRVHIYYFLFSLRHCVYSFSFRKGTMICSFHITLLVS